MSSRTALSFQQKRNRHGWLLTAPAIAVMAVLTVAPLITIFIGALSSEGWTRLQTLIATPGFGQTFRNTAVWVVCGTLGSIALGVIAALALQSKGVRRAGIWRSILLIPWITPIVVTATAWKWFYSRDYGMLNAVLQKLHIIDEPVGWLTNTSVALLAVTMVHIWATFSFVMLMVSAGLQSIPEELYEAARMDGAGVIRSFINITIPSLKNVLFIVSLIVTVWTLNSFLPVWIMTKGGPAGATNIIPVQLYDYFQLRSEERRVGKEG